MICAIMLAYLKQIGRRDRFKDVWIGIGAAVALATAGGVIVFSTIQSYDGSGLQNAIEGSTYFVACAVLTYMTFWMKRQSKNLKGELHAKMEAALTAGSVLAIAGIAFLTVGREGLETVVFLIAIAFHTDAALLGIGAAVGIAAGLTLSYIIYVLGRRVNLRYFFDVMGTLLMLFAAGLLADGIESFQAIGWLPVFTHPLWSTAGLLSEDSTFGDILHSFFGYADSPTPLQVAAYLVYLGIALWAFWIMGAKRKNVHQAA